MNVPSLSLQFMAPEIINASASSPYDPFKGDIWSIGVVTFCMLFGFVPWIIDPDEPDPEQAIFDLVQKGFRADVEDGWGAFFPKEIVEKSATTPGVSETALNLIAYMLEANPEDRYTVDECLQHDWMQQATDSNPTDDLAISTVHRPSLGPRISHSMTVSMLSQETSGSLAGQREGSQYSQPMTFLIDEEPLSDDAFSDDDDDDDDFDAFSSARKEVIKEGWLKKEGKIWKSWKSRYFRLDSQGELYYYKSAESKEPIQSFFISGYTRLVGQHLRNGGQFGIVLSTEERNWKFVCSDHKDRKSWRKAFEKANELAAANRDPDHSIGLL